MVHLFQKRDHFPNHGRCRVGRGRHLPVRTQALLHQRPVLLHHRHDRSGEGVVVEVSRSAGLVSHALNAGLVVAQGVGKVALEQVAPPQVVVRVGVHASPVRIASVTLLLQSQTANQGDLGLLPPVRFEKFETQVALHTNAIRRGLDGPGVQGEVALPVQAARGRGPDAEGHQDHEQHAPDPPAGPAAAADQPHHGPGQPQHHKERRKVEKPFGHRKNQCPR